MQDLNSLIERYLSACLYHKGLNSKTIKAYRIDLHQFSRQASGLWYSKEHVIDFLALLRQKYKVSVSSQVKCTIFRQEMYSFSEHQIR